MLVAALIAQYLRVDIEPFGPETDRFLLGSRRRLVNQLESGTSSSALAFRASTR